MKLTRVLVVDDDVSVREALAQSLELADLQPVVAGSFLVAKDVITPDFDGVILSDIRMPGRDGFHLLDYTLERDADLPVILLTGEGDIPMAVRAMSNGAFGFLEKPCKSEDLLPVLERALKARALVLENRHLKAQLAEGDPAARLVFGVSEQAEALRGAIRAAARRQDALLVCGPPGSGISKVAEIVHLCAPNSKGPFEKRASAGLDRAGLLEAWESATGGVLFLNEVTALPGDTQLALLDALEAGGARLIAGASRDLAQAHGAGEIIEDLYYRLDAAPVRIPSLAERPEDVPVLFRHYVAQAAEQSGIDAPVIEEEMLSALMAQDWPGNARSLMSAAMRFVLGLPQEAMEAAELGLSEQMGRVERSLLIAALGRQNGHASEAARALKLPRKTFYDKLAKHGIRPEDYRR
ncbi:sigma-54-dependent transcriptional regulator [Primorskyibacter sp. S187A]|uniref:sigma-54-dependent transcriptional regulator n=1 Tax=Primorskyibacter sp. S187A TaxID=3415130 RepID=UPI003C7ABABA